MKILSLDSGAKRAGWAVLEDGPTYIFSEVVHFPRGDKEAYQFYRVNLANLWVKETKRLITIYQPDLVVCEIVPVYGMNDAAQGYLANVMATTVYATALCCGVKASQVSAVKVQNAIGIKGKTKKMTKPQVRNGVLAMLPELEGRRKDWVKIFEEPDAIAIGLYTLKNLSS